MARGGFREGAGRPSGSTNKSSPEQYQRLSELAKTCTEETADTPVDAPETNIQIALEPLPLMPYSATYHSAELSGVEHTPNKLRNAR
jgi:hypothetical protein